MGGKEVKLNGAGCAVWTVSMQATRGNREYMANLEGKVVRCQAGRQTLICTSGPRSRSGHTKRVAKRKLGFSRCFGHGLSSKGQRIPHPKRRENEPQAHFALRGLPDSRPIAQCYQDPVPVAS